MKSYFILTIIEIALFVLALYLEHKDVVMYRSRVGYLEELIEKYKQRNKELEDENTELTLEIIRSEKDVD